MLPEMMLYRKEALAHAGSPDDLDQLLHVTSSRTWLVLAALTALVLAALGWSIVTSLDVTVTAAGGIPTGDRTGVLLVAPADSGQLRAGMIASLSCPLIVAPAVDITGKVASVGPRLASSALVARTLGQGFAGRELVPVRVVFSHRLTPGQTLPGVSCQSTITVEQRRVIQLIIP